MWFTRKITLNDPQLSTGQILTREALAEHQQALSLLQLAEQQVQARLDAASEQAEKMLEEVRARCAAEAKVQRAEQQQEFLARTEALFSDWQAQQQSWQAALLPHAEALLAQAMNQLLAELPTPARLQSMLHQLVKAQGRQVSATLLCSPEHQQEVESWLDQNAHLSWQVQCDASLATDSLILTTEKGELHLSWTQICQVLVPHP